MVIGWREGNCQTFKLESVKRNGEKYHNVKGYIDINDSLITVCENYRFTFYKVSKVLKCQGEKYYELSTVASRSFIWVSRYTIILTRRYQYKAEETVWYRFK